MPILEKRGITVKAYIKERLQYTGWSPDVFERQCRNSLKNEEDFTIIDGTTEFTIPLSNLEEYFEPMDVAPIEDESLIIEEEKPEPIDASITPEPPITGAERLSLSKKIPEPKPEPKIKKATISKKE